MPSPFNLYFFELKSTLLQGSLVTDRFLATSHILFPVNKTYHGRKEVTIPSQTG